MSVVEPAALPAPLLLSALAAIVLLLCVWWIRERRLNAQRQSMRAFHALSEAIIAAASPDHSGHCSAIVSVESPYLIPGTGAGAGRARTHGGLD
jgi:hypothetical protein